MQGRIRIGIIGTGNRGVTCLGREIAEQCAERDLEITALCNRGEERMLVAAEELGRLAATHGRRFSPKCYRRASELVSAEDVDVILVTTPTSAHREAAVLAGERGQDQARSAVDSTFDVGDDPLRRKDNCVFKPGADILDHASVHFRYANGIVASLFYSIYGPAAEDEETFEVVGNRGRVILTRHTGSIDIVTTDGRHEVLECKSEAFERSHFGADQQLVSDLAAFARGEPPVVTGSHGYEASRMILSALDSVDQNGETIRL
ncbi:MAG: Gfo/Idh/MocA family oxidoreductase [Lentisphaeria bacterium]|nr:Gfo/Idh/MocA family oxidoreductase [Lentisphaeria bacterium]